MIDNFKNHGCEMCAKVFANKRNLWQHVKERHLGQSRKNSIKDFLGTQKCSNCNFKTDHVTGFRKHLESLKQCQYCELKICGAKSRQVLEQHENNHEN